MWIRVTSIVPQLHIEGYPFDGYPFEGYPFEGYPFEGYPFILLGA